MKNSLFFATLHQSKAMTTLMHCGQVETRLSDGRARVSVETDNDRLFVVIVADLLLVYAQLIESVIFAFLYLRLV